MVNDNLIEVQATPTEPGQPASVLARPLSASYSVQTSVTTVPADQQASITVTGQAPNPSGKLPATTSYPKRRSGRGLRLAAVRAVRQAFLKVSHNLGANLGVCLRAVHIGQADCAAALRPLHDFLAGAVSLSIAQHLSPSPGSRGTGSANPTSIGGGRTC